MFSTCYSSSSIATLRVFLVDKVDEILHVSILVQTSQGNLSGVSRQLSAMFSISMKPTCPSPLENNVHCIAAMCGPQISEIQNDRRISSLAQIEIEQSLPTVSLVPGLPHLTGKY